MPYLTPDSVPAGTTARTLFVPNSSEWLAIVHGALLELCHLSNWEQSDGGITPTEAVLTAIAIFESMQLAVEDVMQVGMITLGLFQTPPSGWLALNGGNYLMSDYPELMEVYPTALKNVPSSGRFTVPDLTGRVPLMAGPGYAELSTGGAATHALTQNEMPSHSHTATFPATGRYLMRSDTGNGYPAKSNNDFDLDGGVNDILTISSTGGNSAHNNMQPYMALNFYLVAKNA